MSESLLSSKMVNLFWHLGCGAAMLDFRRMVIANLKANTAENIIKAAHQLLFFSDEVDKCTAFIQEYIMKQIKPQQINAHAENLYTVLGNYFKPVGI